MQRSLDFGQTWNEGTFPAVRGSRDQDKQWMAIQEETNHLAMTWTEFDEYGSKDPTCYSRILFSKSIDSGLSWSEPISINELEGNCIDDDETTEGAVPSFGINGEIYVAWSYKDEIFFDRSMDGGTTWLDQDISIACLLYTSPSPRDATLSRMPSSA